MKRISIHLSSRILYSNGLFSADWFTHNPNPTTLGDVFITSLFIMRYSIFTYYEIDLSRWHCFNPSHAVFTVCPFWAWVSPATRSDLAYGTLCFCRKISPFGHRNLVCRECRKNAVLYRSNFRYTVYYNVRFYPVQDGRLFGVSTLPTARYI